MLPNGECLCGVSSPFLIGLRQTFGAKASHAVQMICGFCCALQFTNFASAPARLRTKRPEGPYVYLVLSSGSSAFSAA